MKQPKVILLGNAGVGKSSLIERMSRDRFKEDMQSTIGVAYYQLNVDGMLIDIWDTAGSERFAAMLPMYIRDAVVVLLCFEDPHGESNAILRYVKRVQDLAEDAHIIYVHTKCDLEIERNFELLNMMMNDPEIIETSSKTGEGIDKMIDKIYEKCKIVPLEEDHSIYFDIEGNEIVKKKCCYY